jgi:hypothetical protein
MCKVAKMVKRHLWGIINAIVLKRDNAGSKTAVPVPQEYYDKLIENLFFQLNGDDFFFVTTYMKFAVFDNTRQVWSGSMSRREINYHGKHLSSGADAALGPRLESVALE